MPNRRSAREDFLNRNRAVTDTEIEIATVLCDIYRELISGATKSDEDRINNAIKIIEVWVAKGMARHGADHV